MPAIRIFDATIGQTAGIPITTTGNGTITRDGLEAYAQIVVSASGSGVIGTATGSGNVVTLTGATISAGTVSFSANAQSVIIDTIGFENAALTVSGFGTATLAVQWSNLAASGFVAGSVTNVNTGVSATTITADGQYTAPSGGRYLKILTTAFTTGPILVTPTFYAGGGSGSSGGYNPNGQATMANSAPVVIASNQSAVPVGGDVAADAADAGNPVKIGGVAVTTTYATAVAAADRVNAVFDKYGRQVTSPMTTVDNILTGLISTAMTGTTSTAVAGMGAPGAGLKNYITSLVVSNAHATVGTNIELQDGSGGTTFFIVPAAAVYGGCVITFPVPLQQPTANTALYAKNSTTGASTMLSAVGFKAP